MRNRFRLRENFYSPYFRFCSAFTNWHICYMPLRAEDGNFEKNYLKKVRADYRKAERSRRLRLEQARRNRTLRTRVAMQQIKNEDGNEYDSGSSSGNSAVRTAEV